MICPNCGSSVGQEDIFCTKCGQKIHPSSTYSSRGGEPGRFSPRKWIIRFALIALAIAAWLAYNQYENQNNIETLVQNQIDAVKEKHFTQAYYEYTSKDFQNSTNLETFREFMNTHSVFSQNVSIKFTKPKEKGNQADLHVILTAKDGSKSDVQYKIEKEENTWKILNLQLVEASKEVSGSEITTATEELIAPVEKQLKALKNQDIIGSFEGIVSKDFKKNTPLEQFKTFVKNYPILTQFKTFSYQSHSIENNMGNIIVILNPEEEHIPLDYELVMEDGQWKILQLQIVLPPTNASV
jgi:hypothetical protein